MDTCEWIYEFMNPKNSKASDHHRLLLNISDTINLKRSY